MTTLTDVPAARLGFLRLLIAGIKDGLAMRDTYERTDRELSSLSERSLSDLGISRVDIPRIAAAAATRAAPR